MDSDGLKFRKAAENWTARGDSPTRVLVTIEFVVALFQTGSLMIILQSRNAIYHDFLLSSRPMTDLQLRPVSSISR